MKCEWVDCDRNSVKQRYDRIAKFIPVFDRLFFLPRDLRRKAVDRLELSRGDNVLEIGCGTGNSFSYLYDAVGPAGHIMPWIFLQVCCVRRGSCGISITGTTSN
jgi:ubiquinone/menaquinone biosynthesis C-methylase UbiE